MEEKRNFICINCPMGCPLTVTLKDGVVTEVMGYTCKRGKNYGEKEVMNPTRIVTSTVKVEHGIASRVSVKTKEDIPKHMIFPCMKALKDVVVKAPIHIGDVILENVANTGVDVIATKNVPA